MTEMATTSILKPSFFVPRANYDGDNLEAARTWLLKAMHISPAHPTLRFNIATTMQARNSACTTSFPQGVGVKREHGCAFQACDADVTRRGCVCVL